MSTVQHSHDPQAHGSEIIHLSRLSGYQTFGTMLALIRTRNGLSQQQIAEASKPYLRSRRMSFDRRMYGRLENDERFPAFEELEPLYRTFAEVFLVAFSEVERELYVQLAQKRLAQKRKKREHIAPEQWDRLAEALARVDHKKRGNIRLVERAETDREGATDERESPASRRLKAIGEALRTDTSHLLEREGWVKAMLSCLMMTPQKKLVVVQGAMGAGKSHAFALLTQQLAQLPGLYLLPYRFEQGEGTTPDDQLAIFLATILSDLQSAAPDEKQRSLEERIEQVLAVLSERGEHGHKIVLLLDDAQVIFPSALEWSAAWEHFFQSFIRESHTATIYLATRIWPGWMDRRHIYVEETDLPELSPEAGIVMWQRFGFSDVPEAVLRQASVRCGGNPQLIEIRASHLQRRSFAFAWGRGARSRSISAKSENTVRLEAFLEQDSIFDPKTDVEARKVLRQVISSRLSHQASRMLECLACSPLGLPSRLLEQEFPHAELVYDELVRASLVDLSMAASDRAAVIPLVREAEVQALLGDGRREGIEQRVTDLYALWLTTLQDFRDDAEKSALIAEMVIRYIRQRQLLKAAELFIGYGWLCALFGHAARIQRVFEEYVRENRGKAEDAKHEVGRLLLLHRISIHVGQQIARSERDRMYQSIYEKAVSGEIMLQSHAELEVLQNMLLLYTRNGQLTEANQMFERTLERLRHTEQMTPEVYASFLFSKARLLSSLSEREEREQHPAEAVRFIQASADALMESIANWRQCLRHALPLQEHYVKFKLARALNDYACDLRTLGRVPEAQQAIEESIQLKKASGALPHSLAISLSEYSQILAAQGRIRTALSINEEAIQLLEQAIESGDASHRPELGMLLVERANILWLQARLPEARPLLEHAVELIGEKPSRQRDKNRARAQLDEIRLITSSSRAYQLDRRWFPRFQELVNYDDLALLAQAGPFSEEEQAEWEALSSRQNHGDGIAERLLSLIAESRKREFARSIEENRPPVIWYPLLPPALDDIRQRINGLTSLYEEIETQEPNAIVRRLYLDAVDEHRTVLRLCEATALQDQEAVWRYNLKLYGTPSVREFKVALRMLCSTLLEACHHRLAGSVAEEALAQLRAWGISPHEVAAEELFMPAQEAAQQRNHKALAGEQRMFPTTVVKQFFQDVFAIYGADDYEVSISPARDHTYVDTNVHVLVLPETSFSVAKIRQLLAEEIETHAYRAIAGQHSPLALLGSGLANHLATEEGLAFHYVQRVNVLVNGENRAKPWNGTLATGLAAGILTPALPFQELRAFLEKVFLVDKLLTRGADRPGEKALAAARQSAWTRACRTFRGIPALDRAGYCSLKDRIYLEGYLDVSHYLAEHGDEQRLNVGSIGIQHLEDMAELGILAPNHEHQHLALAADLADRLAAFER